MDMILVLVSTVHVLYLISKTLAVLNKTVNKFKRILKVQIEREIRRQIASKIQRNALVNSVLRNRRLRNRYGFGNTR